ncbi:MAG: hypothetical protein GY770_03390 [Aestuariibacter sp.]|nr:hypothetical protein [Aestuariibacter sp.]
MEQEKIPVAGLTMIFTISARGKNPRQPVFDYRARNYANIPIAQIDSVFGFVEKSTLYGGRHFIHPELSDQDHEFLKQVKNKEYVTLFGNAGCALTCPSKICYPSLSELNKFEGGEFKCSLGIKHRSR